MVKNLEIKEKEEGLTEVVATIDKDVARDYYTKATTKVAGSAKLKGYRPGKAPLNFVQKIYDPQIKYEAVNALFPSIYTRIEKDHNIKAMATPEVKGFEEFILGEDLILTILIETIPVVKKMAPLTDVSIKKIEYTYKEDEMVQKELEVLQGLHAHYHELEDKVSLGDFAKVNFSVKGEGIDRPFAARYFMIKKDDPQYSFSSHFEGKELGQTYNEQVTFAENFQDKELAGKTLDVEFIVEEGRTVHQPEIDDELAKKFNHENLESLKTGIKGVLKKRAQMRGLYDSADRIYDTLAKNSEFSISEKVVMNQTQSELQQILQKIMRTQSMHSYLAEKGLTQENFIEHTKNEARHSIEKYLISHTLLEEFGVKSTPAELDEFINEIAEQEVANKKEIVEYYNTNKERKEALKEQLDMKKLAEEVISKVTVTGTEKKDLQNEAKEN